MPYTYPSSQINSGDKYRSNHAHKHSQPHYPQVQPNPQSPLGPRSHSKPKSPHSSSIYLSPMQQQRIMTWRSNSAKSTASTPSAKTAHSASTTSDEAKVKSAPASINLAKGSVSSGGITSSGGMPPPTAHPCRSCTVKRSLCSCSTLSSSSNRREHGGRSAPRPPSGTASGTMTGSGITSNSQTRQKSYYSNKKRNKTTASTLTPLTPVTPPSITADSFRQQPVIVDKRGMPSPAQVEAFNLGAAPAHQYGAPPVGIMPEPALAMPPKPDPPRIAGVRDPISTN